MLQVNERVRFTVDIGDGIACVKAGQVGVVVQVNAGATYPSVQRACGHYDLVGADGRGAYEHAARTDIECVTCQRNTREAWYAYIGDRADAYAEMAEA